VPKKYIRSLLIAGLAALLLSLAPSRAHAQNNAALPSLTGFIHLIRNGNANELRGVYAPRIFAYRVVQQPTGDAGFVSTRENTLTQFELAAQFGSTGLLAHNSMAGSVFFLLREGQRLHMIYGDGRIETFIVRQILRYQALSPSSLKGNFIDLANGSALSTPQLLKRAYDWPGQVILQTCISSNKNSSWGRLFIIAAPYTIPFRESTSEIY